MPAPGPFTSISIACVTVLGGFGFWHKGVISPTTYLSVEAVEIPIEPAPEQEPEPNVLTSCAFMVAMFVIEAALANYIWALLKRMHTFKASSCSAASRDIREDPLPDGVAAWPRSLGPGSGSSNVTVPRGQAPTADAIDPTAHPQVLPRHSDVADSELAAKFDAAIRSAKERSATAANEGSWLQQRLLTKANDHVSAAKARIARAGFSQSKPVVASGTPSKALIEDGANAAIAAAKQRAARTTPKSTPQRQAQKIETFEEEKPQAKTDEGCSIDLGQQFDKEFDLLMQEFDKEFRTDDVIAVQDVPSPCRTR